mmetsp:Transcript_3992/g.6478  ORF Transcript_3992/g.6478 Transcript_3992/m.6478 type:complete len:107 (-) Transcript_3992:245-565(-)
MFSQDSLRSMSQGVRILRLFKFLNALAKDKTIANVFETVLVSMGQVVNIVIILVVLLVMLSVLAVQLFGHPPGRTARDFGKFCVVSGDSAHHLSAHVRRGCACLVG